MKKLVALVFAAAACTLGFSYSAREILGDETYERLKVEGVIQTNRFKPESVEFKLVPKTEVAEKNFGEWTKGTELPAMIGENLYLLPKKGSSIGEVSVILRAISNLEGSTYYSNRRKKWEVLYKEAYCIKGPEDSEKVPDYTKGSADGQVQFCMLNDNSLGKTNYQISYLQSENEIAADFMNTTSVSIGPVKAVSPEKLKIGVVFIDCGEEYVVYMALKAKFFNLGVLEDRMMKSLGARLDAIYNCFMKQIEGDQK